MSVFKIKRGLDGNDYDFARRSRSTPRALKGLAEVERLANCSKSADKK